MICSARSCLPGRCTSSSARPRRGRRLVAFDEESSNTPLPARSVGLALALAIWLPGVPGRSSESTRHLPMAMFDYHAHQSHHKCLRKCRMETLCISDRLAWLGTFGHERAQARAYNHCAP